MSQSFTLHKYAFIKGYLDNARTLANVAAGYVSSHREQIKEILRKNPDVLAVIGISGIYGLTRPSKSTIGRLLRGLNYGSIGGTGYGLARNTLKDTYETNKKYKQLLSEGLPAPSTKEIKDANSKLFKPQDYMAAEEDKPATASDLMSDMGVE